MIQTIEKEEFIKKLESKDYILIDIRTKYEYDSERINGAILIDFYKSNFKDRLNQLDKNKNYLIYCRSGSRTSYALNIFKELGFKNVYDLKGGLMYS